MYKWQQVKAMKTKGLSIKQIAARLKLSRNTVRKYLRSSKPPQFNAREYAKQLVNYQESIKEMLDKKYIGTRIHSELADKGYTGSLSTIHRYIRELSLDEEIKAKVTTRVETQPGQQMQYDWTEWELSVNGEKIKIYVHEVVLSYSRLKYYTFSLSITTSDVIRAIDEAIHYFGGTTLEIVIDNGKQMVITHHKNGVVRYNDEFLRFCGLYGIGVNPCQNYRPRTKGKVERPFYYLKEHLLRGLEVVSLTELETKLKEFTEQYNNRVHSGLKEIPQERFVCEKKALREIVPLEPGMLYERQFRKVSNDGYISWDGEFYPVAMRLCLREVMVEPILGRWILVYDEKGGLISKNEITLIKKGIKPPHPEHEEMNKAFKEKKEQKKSQIITKFEEEFEADGKSYVMGLKEKVGENLYWHIKEIMSYTEIYGREDVKEILGECMKIRAYHKNSVKRLLGAKKMKTVVSLDGVSHFSPCMVNISRELSVYRVEVNRDE